MEDKVNVTVKNSVKIAGEIMDEFTYSHSLFDEAFFTSHLKVPRLSNIEDMVPITVSESVMDINSLDKGSAIEVYGQFRSYNRYINGKNRLILTVFVKEFNELNHIDDGESTNSITLEGYICKPPQYRTTPFGREITDLLVAVNRAYNKSDYIPCICWGGNARVASKYIVGDKVKIAGRIQSRKYQKRLDDERIIDKIAYEVSVTKIDIIK